MTANDNGSGNVRWLAGAAVVAVLLTAGCASTDSSILGTGTSVTASDPTRLTFVAEAGSGVATGRPAGSTPYLGETGMEMQVRAGRS